MDCKNAVLFGLYYIGGKKRTHSISGHLKNKVLPELRGKNQCHVLKFVPDLMPVEVISIESDFICCTTHRPIYTNRPPSH